MPIDGGFNAVSAPFQQVPTQLDGRTDTGPGRDHAVTSHSPTSRRTKRSALMLLPAITIATGLTLAAGASPADALARQGDPCGGLIYAYQYWGGEYVTEVQSAGYETDYAIFAYAQLRDTGDEIQRNNC
jgi:hypothetical protein